MLIMALNNQELDQLVEKLTDYKFIIIAGLLGEGRLRIWLESIDDLGLKLALQKELCRFSQDLALMFTTEDRQKHKETQDLSTTERTRDLFYQIIIGVKPNMLSAEPQPGLQREPTGAPQPGLFALQSSADKAMGIRRDWRHKDTETKAIVNIKTFFKAHPTLAHHLFSVITQLEKINKAYTQFMLDEHHRLQQALEQTRRELKQTDKDEVDTEPEEDTQEVATQILSSPEEEIYQSTDHQPLERAATLQYEFRPSYFKAPPLKRAATAPIPGTETGELQLFASSLQKAKDHLLSLR